MKCPECGNVNFEIAEFCAMCGKPFSSGAAVSMESRTSSMAIAAFVLAILSPVTCFVAAIPAVILGIIALIRIKQSGGAQRGQGFAIAAIALPVVLLPVAALMMGIMMPSLTRARSLAFRTVCATNLSGLGKAMLIYANDYDDAYPDPNNWCDLLIDYVEVVPKSLQCEGAEEGRSHYAMNPNVTKLGMASPPDMVLLFETQAGWNMSGGAELLTTDHHEGQGCNVLFVDTHVEFVREQELGNLRWE